MKENNTYHEGMEGTNLPESLRVNPFSVPTDYFETLTSTITAQIGLEGKVPPEAQAFSVPDAYFGQLTKRITAQVALAKPDEEAQSWSTPKGYFETLQDNIQSRIKVETIVQKQESFVTAARYFETLQDNIQSRIKVEATVQKQESFVAPAGYFESLSERIQSKVFEDNLRSTIAVDGFSAPALYFEKLSANITAKVKATSAKTVVEDKPVRRMYAQRWIQYVAAACVATVIGTASYNAVIEHDEVDVTETHLASIEEEEIVNYLTSSKGNDDLLYIMEYIYQPAESEGVCSKIKEDDIEDYLNYTL